MFKPHLLLIDDEPTIHHAFQKVFGAESVRLSKALTGEDGVRAFNDSRPDAVVLDIKLPDMSGIEVFERLHAIDARTPVIFITGHGSAEFAIEAMKRGAFDYLLKPLELSVLRLIVQEAMESSRRMRTPAAILPNLAPPEHGDGFIGQCPKMQDVYKAIGRVARQNVTVLITGESGVGKELVARAVYQHSQRAEKPFLAVNCAAIPEALLESELFGHERGSFTGADRQRIGKFERCDGGTLFLDEVGDMAPALQAKLLRVLQEQTFERLGGSETIRADVRIIAATNADLGTLVVNGRFRADLFFRLNVFAIPLPPLRDRGDDLELLATHFARRFAHEFGKDVVGLQPRAIDRLRAHKWPGNVRELQSVLKQAVLNSRGRELDADDFGDLLRDDLVRSESPGAFDWDSFVRDRCEAGSESLYAEALSIMERELLPRVLKLAGGSQVQAAKMLGIARGNLRNRLRTLRIVDERVGDEQAVDDIDD